LKGVQSIQSKADAFEIIIKYQDEKSDPFELVTKQKGVEVEDGPTQTLRYSCAGEAQRDLIVDQLFDNGIRCCSLSFPQTFKVQKEAEGGKKHTRILKLTSDSVLNFADKVIKREIPYSTIQSFYVDTEDKKKMFINFMSAGQKRSYIFVGDNAETLRDSLLDAIVRFKFYVQIEMDLFKLTKVNASIDKFYDKAGQQDSFDTKKWKQSFRLDTPTKDLLNVFKRFKPDNIGRAPFTSQIVREIRGLSEEECDNVVKVMDPKARGFILYDDLVAQWIYLKKQKAMIDKKKQALQATKK